MKGMIFGLGSSLSILIGIFFFQNHNSAQAQILPPNDVYMFGTIENDQRMSGYFGKNSQDFKNKNWCVFIGANGNTYKLTLIERNIHELYIDGQKIPDSQIWKHTAEYKPFLEKFWRSQEIENESEELELQIKPIDRKMEAINKEIEKLDQTQEKLDSQLEKNSAGFLEQKKNINAQQKRLEEIQRGLENRIESLSKQQENLSKEQNTLELNAELNKILKQIGDDLVSLGVIKDTKKLSYKLSNLELIVNGKKASPEVLALLKKKYIVELNGESGFIYRWKW